MLAVLFAVPVTICVWIVAIGIVVVRRAGIDGIQYYSQQPAANRGEQIARPVKASFGVSPLRTTSNTPSVSAERITASVAAITGGESITMNL